jgi:hypothetical protein
MKVHRCSIKPCISAPCLSTIAVQKEHKSKAKGYDSLQLALIQLYLTLFFKMKH